MVILSFLLTVEIFICINLFYFIIFRTHCLGIGITCAHTFAHLTFAHAHFVEGLLRIYLVVLKCYMRKCLCAGVYAQISIRKRPCTNVTCANVQGDQ